MGDIVNLKRARKAAERTRKGELAAQNRARHGRTKDAARPRRRSVSARRASLTDTPATMLAPLSGSPLQKRSLILKGHATSLALEAPFWRSLERWAADERRPLSDLVADIDAARQHGSLASAVRVALLLRAEAQAQ